MGRENVLTFGKITLVSSGENVEQLMVHLDALIEKHGYPDQVEHGSHDDDFDDMEEELKPEGEKQMEEAGYVPPFKKEE